MDLLNNTDCSENTPKSQWVAAGSLFAASANHFNARR